MEQRRSLNLYVLFQVGQDEKIPLYERIMGNAPAGGEKKVRLHEVASLRSFVQEMLMRGAGIDALDGFYSSYTIPRISKEFDVLKFSKDKILNIELKSVPVKRQEIARQLVQNRYYLKHLEREIVQFTYVSATRQFFCLNKADQAVLCNGQAVRDALDNMSPFFDDDPDILFEASRFLVSPTDEPERFLKHQYFLTQHQQRIEDELTEAFRSRTQCRFVSIAGAAGTGKTLLMFDMARLAAQWGRVCVLHCGTMDDALRRLDSMIDAFDIIPISALTQPQQLCNYRFLFADECHHMPPALFDAICSLARKHQISCIFSADERQICRQSEKRAGIARRIKTLPGLMHYELTNRIRTNPALAVFISKLLALDSIGETKKYPVELLYAENDAEACTIAAYFQSKGYVRLPAQTQTALTPPIGREYDRVLVTLDKRFYYNASGALSAHASEEEEALYEQLFYQAVTRVKETLGLLIVGNPVLFAQISGIFSETDADTGNDGAK